MPVCNYRLLLPSPCGKKCLMEGSITREVRNPLFGKWSFTKFCDEQSLDHHDFFSYLRCTNGCSDTAKYVYASKEFNITWPCEATCPQNEKLKDIQRFKDAFKHTVQSGYDSLKVAYDITALVWVFVVFWCWQPLYQLIN